MSASLVGSEMCIRDRWPTPRLAPMPGDRRARSCAPWARGMVCAVLRPEQGGLGRDRARRPAEAA
eukprot:12832594-Alexandrium_andersonii.AAC.1